MSPVATFDDDTARAAVLEAADAVFYRLGVAGAGMTEIRDESGVSLRRLYALYPSKRELVAAWLAARHGTWMEWFTAAVERRRAGGEDAVLAAFGAIEEWSLTPGYRGCAFLNTAAEAGEIDDIHRAIIARHKRDLTAVLAELAAAAGSREPDRLAGILAVLIDGAIVQSAVLGSSRPVAAAREAAAQLLEASR